MLLLLLQLNLAAGLGSPVVAPANVATTVATVAASQVHVGTVAAASQATTAATVAATQGHVGTVAAASSARTASTVAATQVHQGLVVASASQANTVSTVAGSLGAGVINGTVASLNQALSAATVAATQVHRGSLASAAILLQAGSVVGVVIDGSIVISVIQGETRIGLSPIDAEASARLGQDELDTSLPGIGLADAFPAAAPPRLGSTSLRAPAARRIG